MGPQRSAGEAAGARGLQLGAPALGMCHVLGTVLGSATDKVPALTELQETDNQAVHQSQPGT